MITSAGDLWSSWVASKALLPQNYDRDLADELEARLPPTTGRGPIPLGDRLDAAGWTARDLIRFLAPHLASFSSMLRDLLAMYSRIGATSADGENLRVSYEFEEGHPVDVELHAFRETVERVEISVSEIDQFVYPAGRAFPPPRFVDNDSRTYSELCDQGSRATGMGLDAFRGGAAPEICPLPDVTGDLEIDQLSVRHRQVIDAVIAIARSYVTGSAEEVDPGRRHPPHQLFYDLSDCWLALQIGLNQHLTAGGDVAGELAGPEARQDFSAWLDSFWVRSAVEEEVLVEHATNVLNLPEWGQRHDLYSAWVTTQFDAALPSEHFSFHVENGTLRFPFKATLLARLETPTRPVELWCELRQPASGPLSGGRKAGVQPDYQFVDGKTRAPLIAVEVKQYLRASATDHRATMTDYLRNLPQVTVVLVGHGPLGRSITSKLPSALRDRARVHETVRPGEVASQQGFQDEITALLPPAGALVPPLRRDGSVAARLTLSGGSAEHGLQLRVLSVTEDLCEMNREHPATSLATLRVGCEDSCPQVVDLHSGPTDQALVFATTTDEAPGIFDLGLKLTIQVPGGNTSALVPTRPEHPRPIWVIGWWDGETEVLEPWLSESAPLDA